MNVSFRILSRSCRPVLAIFCLVTMQLVLFLLPGSSFAVQDCDLNGEHVNPANGFTTQGKTGIMRCRDRDSGELQREEELRDGRFIGLVRYYKQNKLASEHSINEKGNRDGLLREFLPDGRVVREDTYRNGNAVGLGRSWHATGKVKRVVFRDDNGRELAAAEYNPAGQLKDIRCGNRPLLGRQADDAALCGFASTGPVTSALYSDKGVLQSKVTYHKGIRSASDLFWDNCKLREQELTADRIITQRSFNRDGTKTNETRWRSVERGRLKESEQEYHESGSLVRERHWLDGNLTSDTSYYLNGQKKVFHKYFTRQKTAACDITEYHDNGRIFRQGIYLLRKGEPDRPVDAHRVFNKDGQLQQEREYDERGRLSREKEFDRDGRVLHDDAVFEDGSRKAYTTVPRPSKPGMSVTP